MTEAKFVFNKFRERRHELNSMDNNYINYKINTSSMDNTFKNIVLNTPKKPFRIQNPYYIGDTNNYYTLDEIPNVFGKSSLRKYANHKLLLQIYPNKNYETPKDKYNGYKFNIRSPFK